MTTRCLLLPVLEPELDILFALKMRHHACRSVPLEVLCAGPAAFPAGARKDGEKEVAGRAEARRLGGCQLRWSLKQVMPCHSPVTR
jgi:hypothetical protein